MKLSSTLLHTLAVAAVSIGVAGCGPVETETPATTAEPDDKWTECKDANPPERPIHRDPCPGCGMG